MKKLFLLMMVSVLTISSLAIADDVMFSADDVQSIIAAAHEGDYSMLSDTAKSKISEDQWTKWTNKRAERADAAVKAKEEKQSELESKKETKKAEIQQKKEDKKVERTQLQQAVLDGNYETFKSLAPAQMLEKVPTEEAFMKLSEAYNKKTSSTDNQLTPKLLVKTPLESTRLDTTDSSPMVERNDSLDGTTVKRIKTRRGYWIDIPVK